MGGPTAEFRGPACEKQRTKGACRNRQCLFPECCKNLIVDHSDYRKLLRELRTLPGVKKVFVRSGFRFDYLMADPDRSFLKELCQYHVSGQLRVAPEHISNRVLQEMGKPRTEVYRSFVEEFEKINRELGLKQYIVPYLMSSHPGSTLEDAVALAEYLRDLGYMPEQVQDFYPTPGTVKEALLRSGRRDLIGFDRHCLIPPRKIARPAGEGQKKSRQRLKAQGQNQHGGPKIRLEPQSRKKRKETMIPERDSNAGRSSKRVLHRKKD